MAVPAHRATTEALRPSRLTIVIEPERYAHDESALYTASFSPNRPSQSPADLEAHLSAVESQLAALGDALRSRDADGIDHYAGELHRALARAVDRFTHAARSGDIPQALRHRLALASGEMAAQRESLARATAALDRAMDVLLPRDPAPLYSAYGNSERASNTGMVQA